MSKFRLALSLLLVLAFAVVALPAFTPAQAQGGGKIVMWSRNDLTNTEDPPAVTLKRLIDEFTAETGIEVVYEQVAWDQIAVKLALAARSGGDMPDIVELSDQHVASLIAQGALMDIAGLVNATDWAADLSAAEITACTYGDMRFCVGADFRGGAWYYNVADFPNGWPTDNAGWLAEGERLKAEGKYVATFFAGRHYGAVELTWAPLFLSAGGSVFDDEGLPDWASEENVAVVEWMRELLAKGYIPETCFTGDFTAGETPWVDGTAGAVRGGSWSYLYIPGLQQKFEANETELGVAPGFNGGPNYVALFADGWGISSRAKNVEGAMAWINFFMKPETLAEWAVNHYGIPTIGSAFASEAFASEFYQVNAENLGANGVLMEKSLCYVEALTELSTTLQELMINPGMDAAKALKESQDEMRKSCGQK